MLDALAALRKRDPLLLLTLVALVPRVLAAIFSQGYFAHDDHFLVIEAAGSWVFGHDYNSWLPWNQQGTPHPSGHGMLYVGLHYLLFSGLKAIGLTDPKSWMLIVRLLHAVWSLLVVRTGYRIALKLADAEIAWRCGLFLALFCYMPFLSVRNLVEMVCVPLLMLGALRLLHYDTERSWKHALVAGIWIGLAMNIRFQTIFFAGGSGLALLLRRDLRGAIVHGLGIALPLVIIQGGIDLFIWDRPFAELTEYVQYNMLNTTTYFNQPWYNFLLLLSVVFIPPFSLAVFFGFFRAARKGFLIWLPVFTFLAFHSYFPNKQERFILPIVPLFFVLGYCAWEQWREVSTWWKSRTRLWRGVMTWTWSINLLLLVVLTFSYSKRSRVEALSALHDRNDVQSLIMEDSEEHEAPMPPLFYSGHWGSNTLMVNDTTIDLAQALTNYSKDSRPNYVLFIGEEALAKRMARVRSQVGPLEEVGRYEPGLLDRAVHWLNPINRNESITVMRITTGRDGH